MRPTEIYLRPLFLSDGTGTDDGSWGRLAGGAVRFSHVELMERCGMNRRVLAYDDAAASGEPAIGAALAELEGVRPPVSGLDFAAPRIVGIVNVTPDSFSDGGKHHACEDAVARGRRCLEEGADILDIGGESTRPGSVVVDEDTECARILPVIEALRDDGVPLSCDTRKSAVMRKAVAAGAHIINDISGLTYDPQAPRAAAELGVPVIVMHSKGEPDVMQNAPEYENVCLEVFDTLRSHIAACEEAGIPRSMIIADPGIGFGKTFDHNLELLDDLALFHGLGVPLMLGVSRKGFLGALTGVGDARSRAVSSTAAALCGLMRGVQLFRVHDVKETVEAFAVWRGVRRRSVS